MKKHRSSLQFTNQIVILSWQQAFERGKNKKITIFTDKNPEDEKVQVISILSHIFLVAKLGI